VSVDKPNLGIEIWDGILSEEPAPAVKKAVERRLAAFDQHKDALLGCLRPRGPGSQIFDANACWCHLTRLALLYFLQQLMAPPGERAARLRKLAEVLDRARALAKKAAQDDLGCDDLLSALFRGRLPRDPGGTLVRDEGGSLRVEYFAEIGLTQIVNSLGDYRAAVLRAADDVPAAGSGKPAILPKDYFHALAEVYRTSTGREPGAGPGPFSKFVMTFRTALDRHKSVDNDSLIEAIKRVRREDGRL
jgi:hypothetical protein